jgi:catechol 2,3-dioxygenase-like lactoylglutathione lyase family enzyme
MVARWAFQTLTDRAEALVSDADDRDTLKQAVALDGLLFDLLPVDQRARVAKVLERAADELRAELCDRTSQCDRDFAERLDIFRLGPVAKVCCDGYAAAPLERIRDTFALACQQESPMSIRRVMPDIRSEAMEESRDFYGLLGFEEVMNHGWVMTLASPSNPTAQVTFMSHDKTAPVVPDMSVEVDDVDAAYAVMRESGAEVVHPLQDEEWGVRRFFVRDPNGRVVNVLSHR